MGNKQSINISTKGIKYPCIDENFFSISDFNIFAHCISEVVGDNGQSGQMNFLNTKLPYDKYKIVLGDRIQKLMFML